MSAEVKIGRNEPCPCGSGEKYKKCCYGKLPWPQILAAGTDAYIHCLSARGKNIQFIGALAAALQIDHLRPPKNYADFKKAFTTKAVNQIHQAIVDLWPDGPDLGRVLKQQAKTTSGLYVGTYEPEAILKGVTRHSLYSDKILLVDPFYHPINMRDEFNPLLHPDEHRVTTLKYALLWLWMWPWIDAGVVNFIRVPGDFDASLLLETFSIQKKRAEKYPELRKIADAESARHASEMDAFRDYFVLGHPDESFVNFLREKNPNISQDEIDKFLKHLQQRRDAHPYYLEPLEKEGKASEFLMETSGANYEMARRTALLSGSYLITDLSYRWKEIELDRKEAGIDERQWSPFAKAFQNLEVRYLENVPVDLAVQLRREMRLEDVRSFFRKVWQSTASGEPFDEANVENLASELHDKMREAEDEWDKIDRDLLKWMGGALALSAGALVQSGGAEWLPAAATTVAGGVTGLGVAQHKRASFAKRFPASWLLKLKART